MKSKLCLLFCLAINFIALAQQKINKDFVFKRLNGKFTLKILSPDPSQKSNWIKSGNGEAIFEGFFDGTYIRERVATTINANSYHMDNTIGVDSRSGDFRLIAVDKEFSTMDVFNGRIDGEKLVFDNLLSDIKMYNPKGEEINFKLTYSFLDKDINELLVEFSKDRGETWLPFSRQLQTPIKP